MKAWRIMSMLVAFICKCLTLNFKPHGLNLFHVKKLLNFQSKMPTVMQKSLLMIVIKLTCRVGLKAQGFLTSTEEFKGQVLPQIFMLSRTFTLQVILLKTMGLLQKKGAT